LRFTEFELRQLDEKGIGRQLQDLDHPIRQAISAASFQQFRA
jgi:hypothetical protein